MHLRIEEAASRGDSAAMAELWTLANFHEIPADLCALTDAVSQGLIVRTANGALAGDLETLCPAANVIVDGDSLGR